MEQLRGDIDSSRPMLTKGCRIAIRAKRRLLLVVKVVFVVFPNSEGLIGNSTNPITRYSGRTFKVSISRTWPPGGWLCAGRRGKDGP